MRKTHHRAATPLPKPTGACNPMTIGSKSILARLLAEENLTVNVDGSAKTAYFNLQNRSITIPNWEDASPELYDLLLGHEVGHARNTPTEGWHDNVKGVSPQFKSFLNVCEDARIEKKMRRKYPGLRRSFLKAYAELFEKDFFGVRGKDLSNLLLVDRINLATKLGSLSNLTFAGEEKVLLDRVIAAETWEEVVAVAKDLFEYCKKEKEEKQEEMPDLDGEGEDFASDEDEAEQEMNGESDDDSQELDSEDFSDDEEAEDGEELPSRAEGQPDEEDEEEEDEPASVTDEAFRKNEEKLATVGEVVVLTPPSQILKALHPVSNILASFEEANAGMMAKHSVYFSKLNRQFIERNRNAIDQYVKEFQMRKSATQWKKARVADTGDIDASKLSRYRLTDELFKARTILPQAKNHGMVLLLDLSSSMRYIIQRAMEHTLVLATVCKRVGIPFTVYGFTDGHYRRERNANVEYVANELVMTGRVMELLNSSMKTNDYRNQTSWLLSYAHTLTRQVNYDYSGDPLMTIPGIMEMGSTPTATALAVMAKILPEFRRKFNLEKLSLVVMTDGAADTTDEYIGVYEGRLMTYGLNRGYMGTKSYQLKLGNDKPKRIHTNALTKYFNEYIRKSLNVEVFGFFLASKSSLKRRDYGYLMSLAVDSNGYGFGSAALELWRKQGYFETHYDGFSRFWVVNPDEGKIVDVEKDMTSAKKAKAFASANQTKKLNRIIATKFMELAA